MVFDAVTTLELSNQHVGLGMITAGGRLKSVQFLDRGREYSSIDSDLPLVTEVMRQIRCYATDSRYKFNLPLAPEGTAFQQKVWLMLRQIECGDVMQYGEVAKALTGSRGAARAVGNACRHNPLPVIVPCHRVVAKQGIGGFSGDGVDGKVSIKRQLLLHEGVAVM